MIRKKWFSRTLTLLLLVSTTLNPVVNLQARAPSKNPKAQQVQDTSTLRNSSPLQSQLSQINSMLSGQGNSTLAGAVPPAIAAPTPDGPRDPANPTPNAQPFVNDDDPPETWGDTSGGGGFDSIFEPSNSPTLDTSIRRLAGLNIASDQKAGVLADPNLGNGNFTFQAPAVNLPGRGLDVSLNLNYHSNLWYSGHYTDTEDNRITTVTYDKGDTWIAAGWSMGLPSLVRVTRDYYSPVNEYMIIDGDGTRHAFSGNSHGAWMGYTTDGSMISYSAGSSRAYYPDGTIVTFGNGNQPCGSNTSGCYLPAYATRITDASGNFISITYKPDNLGRRDGPRIETITDTLGRTITFHYETSQVNPDSGKPILTAITAPGLNGETRTLVRLHYAQMIFNAQFRPDVEVRSNPGAFVLDAIYYPADQTGYWFGDADSFSSYGMLAKVSQRRSMTFQPGSNFQDMGTIMPGIMTREQAYNYPLSPPNPLPSRAPTFTQMTASWEGMTTAPSTTLYETTKITTTQTMTVTHPNGTKDVQFSSTRPGVGRVSKNITYDSANSMLKKTVINWGSGFRGAPRPTGIHTTDALSQTTVVSYTYGTNFDQLVYEDHYGYYDADHETVPPLLKRIKTEYVDDWHYSNRNILNLPSKVTVCADLACTQTQVASLTEFEYDNNGTYGECFRTDCSLANAPGVIQYDRSYDPYDVVYVPRETTTDCWTRPGRCTRTRVCEGGCHYEYECEPDSEYCRTTTTPGHWERGGLGWTPYRGNVTKISNYGNATGHDGAIVQTLGYDITGNVLTSTLTSVSPNQQTISRYSAQTQYAFPDSVTSGSGNASLTSAFSYNFNTGLPLTATDPNGQVVNTTYDGNSLRPLEVKIKSAANSSYELSSGYQYDDANLSFTQTVTDTSTITATWVSQSVTRLNGLGLTKRVETLDVGGIWNYSDIQYDQMGRAVTTTLPYTATQVPQESIITYDALSRVTAIKAPDGSTVRTFYNETTLPDSVSPTFGQTVRTVDAWGRQRWSRSDALGRVVQVVEPDPNGNGSVITGTNTMSTTYAYDGNGNLTQINQGAQVRRFQYDSLGRLTQQYLPERSATLNDSGGRGSTWSDVFTYDGASNLRSSTDARGVRTDFNYGNDPLNRLQSVAYSFVGGFNTTDIVPVAPVNYSYMPTGDVTRIQQVSSGSGSSAVTELYNYDARSRVSRKTTTFVNRPAPANQQVVDYAYDGASRLTDLTYPKEYGMGTPGNEPRKVVHLGYDAASRANLLQVSGINYASGIVYNASNQATSLMVGSGGPAGQLRETYAYSQTTGLLESQQVTRSGVITPLLDLAYNYNGPNGAKTGELTRITNRRSTGPEVSNYEYDALGRLKRMIRGNNPALPDWAQAYSYDNYGNRTGVTATGNTQPVPQDGIANLTYNTSNNHISTPGYTYDATGNLTRGQRADGTWQRYQYDAAGRLVKVRHDTQNVTLEAYSYGASRERLIAQQGESAEARTYYAWSGGVVISEYVDSGTGPRLRTLNWSRSYVYLGARLLATLTKNGTTETVNFHHPDRLGTRLITDASSNQTWEQETLPFGVALRTPTGSRTGNQTFTSYDRSGATGVDYAVNRNYDSKLGRFLEVDPLGAGVFKLGNPQSFNLYAYVEGDPINYTDGTGHFLKCAKCSKEYIEEWGLGWWEQKQEMCIHGGCSFSGAGYETKINSHFIVDAAYAKQLLEDNRNGSNDNCPQCVSYIVDTLTDAGFGDLVKAYAKESSSCPFIPGSLSGTCGEPAKGGAKGGSKSKTSGASGGIKGFTSFCAGFGGGFCLTTASNKHLYISVGFMTPGVSLTAPGLVIPNSSSRAEQVITGYSAGVSWGMGGFGSGISGNGSGIMIGGGAAGGPPIQVSFTYTFDIDILFR